MQRIAPILLLFFSLFFMSGNAFASSTKWTRLFENSQGTAYVDLEGIMEKNGFVYFWSLVDYVKPTGQGFLSSKVYIKGDCRLFRVQNLRYVHYTQQMARNNGQSSQPKSPEWRHPPPVSLMEITLKSVCKHVSSLKSISR